MAIIKKSIERPLAMQVGNKLELEQVQDAVIDIMSVTATGDGEVLVSVSFKNVVGFVFASGSFKNFVLDNIDSNPDLIGLDGGYKFDKNIDGDVVVTYNGKKKSKNNRQYNDWTVKVIPAE